MNIRYNTERLDDKAKIVKRYLDIVDCMQINPKARMTASEKDMLLRFICLPSKYEFYRFSSTTKKIVMKQYFEETGKERKFQDINNRLYSLIKKGFLRRDDDNIIYLAKFLKRGLEELLKSLNEGKEFRIQFIFSNEKKIKL